MSNQSIWRKPLSEIISDLMGRRQVGAPAGPSVPARRGRSFGLQGLFTGLSRSKEITALTIEHGMVKLVVAHGTEVLDYRVTMVDPQWFREGLTSDVVRMSQAIQTSLIEMDGSHQRIIGAVPGYQVTLGRMDLPNARDLDPAVVIPREVSQRTGVSAENSHIAWHRLGDNVDTGASSNWLVVQSATRHPTFDGMGATSLMPTTAERAVRRLRYPCHGAWELSVTHLQNVPSPRRRPPPFPSLFASPIGGTPIRKRRPVPGPPPMNGSCRSAQLFRRRLSVLEEIALKMVCRSSKLAYQSAYWGAEPVDESVLVNRLTDIVGRTVALHDAGGIGYAACIICTHLHNRLPRQHGARRRRPGGRKPPAARRHPRSYPMGPPRPSSRLYVVKTSGTKGEPLKRATWTLTGSGSSQICQPPFG